MGPVDPRLCMPALAFEARLTSPGSFVLPGLCYTGAPPPRYTYTSYTFTILRFGSIQWVPLHHLHSQCLMTLCKKKPELLPPSNCRTEALPFLCAHRCSPATFSAIRHILALMSAVSEWKPFCSSVSGPVMARSYLESACSSDCLCKFKEIKMNTLIAIHLPCARGSRGSVSGKRCVVFSVLCERSTV